MIHSDSDIIYLHLPVRSIVIVCSVKAAIALFDKKSHIYSDRPTSVMVELFGSISLQ